MAKEKLEQMVGNVSHKECSNSYCKDYKKGKTEHLFIKRSNTFSANDYGWECKACEKFTRVG